MTMFHLAHPVPSSAEHPAFIELLGALDTGGGVHPWAEADNTFRKDAMGRLQEYYCHALDAPYRESFKGWVSLQLASALRDKVIVGESAPEVYGPGGMDEKTLRGLQREGGGAMGAVVRNSQMRAHFFRSLQAIVASNCKGLSTTSMKL